MKMISWIKNLFKKKTVTYYQKTPAHCFECGFKGKKTSLFWGTQKGYMCKKCDVWWTDPS